MTVKNIIQDLRVKGFVSPPGIQLQ